MTSELGLYQFNFYRNDRSPLTSVKKSGGGVLVAVHSDFPSVELTSSVDNVEHLSVGVDLSGSKLLLGAVYIPPSCASDVYSSYRDAVEEVCSSIDHNTVVVIAGDFNQPSIDWDNITGCTLSLT